MEAAMTLRPNNVHHLRPHLDFIEESGGVVSRRSYRTAWLGFPRVHRWGGGASRGFCSLALAPTAYPPAPSWSLEILLRSEDDGWRPLPLVTVLAVGRGWRWQVCWFSPTWSACNGGPGIRPAAWGWTPVDAPQRQWLFRLRGASLSTRKASNIDGAGSDPAMAGEDGGCGVLQELIYNFLVLRGLFAYVPRRVSFTVPS
jgi:hypothetical protein